MANKDETPLFSPEQLQALREALKKPSTEKDETPEKSDDELSTRCNSDESADERLPPPTTPPTNEARTEAVPSCLRSGNQLRVSPERKEVQPMRALNPAELQRAVKPSSTDRLGRYLSLRQEHTKVLNEHARGKSSVKRGMRLMPAERWSYLTSESFQQPFDAQLQPVPLEGEASHTEIMATLQHQ